MARSRNIKPGFFVNDLLAEIEPIGRLLFIGLWTIADKDGRLLDRPRRIHAACLPYEQANVDLCLDQLQSKGFILRYSIDGESYIQIINWLKHQRPHHKEKRGEIPEPTENCYKNQEDIHACAKHDPSMTHLAQPCPDMTRLIPDTGYLIPDTGLLIPDTGLLIPDTGLPIPDTTEKILSSKLNDCAKNVLLHLNKKTGKNFKPVESNLKFIRARLRETGQSVLTLTAVVDLKTAEWINDPTFSKYLRPSTLFNAEKYSQYYGEIGVETPQQRNDRELNEWAGDNQ